MVVVMPCYNSYITKGSVNPSYGRLKTHKRKKNHLRVITIYEMHFFFLAKMGYGMEIL